MLKSRQCRNTSVGVQSHKARQQIYLQLVESCCMFCHGHATELGESRLEVAEFERIGPVVLVGGAKDFENFEDLIDFGIPHE